MRISLLNVRLIREKHPQVRRVRSLWNSVHLGSVVDVENNRRRERGTREWMPCRVHRIVDDQVWVIPVYQ